MSTKIPFDTRLGRGWLVVGHADLSSTVLPGGPEPVAGRPSSIPPIIRQLAADLAAYFNGDASRWPLVPELADRAGTSFLRDVYRVVVAIPPGETMTYGEVAARVGHPKAARAVGGAMARNQFAPLIPCHRVVPAAGGVGHYAGGAEMKETLLELEAAGG